MRSCALFLILILIGVSGKLDQWHLRTEAPKRNLLIRGNAIQDLPFDKYGFDNRSKEILKPQLRTEMTGRGIEKSMPSPRWDKGTVPYHVDEESYDEIIVSRVQEAIKEIEDVSCVLFKKKFRASRRKNSGAWLHITNPEGERECIHEMSIGDRGDIVMVLGYDCMEKQDITHALLHALGFKDEVTHPGRDSYVRVLWENIQPKYYPLFTLQKEPMPYQMLVEYDTSSVMHFHDRAFSINGKPTVIPLVSGVQITPSESLSLFDMTKLRVVFGQECNKRKFDNLVESCKKSIIGNTNNNPNENTYDSDSDGGEDSGNKEPETSDGEPKIDPLVSNEFNSHEDEKQTTNSLTKTAKTKTKKTKTKQKTKRKLRKPRNGMKD